MSVSGPVALGLSMVALSLVLGGGASCELNQQAERKSTTWTTPSALPRSDPLPEDQLAFNSDRTGNFELFVMPAAGGEATQLTHEPAYDSWSPRVSPDRRTLLFYRTPKGVHDRDYTQAALWAVAADGTGPASCGRQD